MLDALSDESKVAAQNINYGRNKILSIIPKDILKAGYNILCIGRDINMIQLFFY